jgi:hypothetical protein
LAKKMKKTLETKFMKDTRMSQMEKGLVKNEAKGTTTMMSSENKAA